MEEGAILAYQLEELHKILFNWYTTTWDMAPMTSGENDLYIMNEYLEDEERVLEEYQTMTSLQQYDRLYLQQ